MAPASEVPRGARKVDGMVASADKSFSSPWSGGDAESPSPSLWRAESLSFEATPRRRPIWNGVSRVVLLPVRAGQAVVRSVQRVRRRKQFIANAGSSSYAGGAPLLGESSVSNIRLALDPFHAKRGRAWTAPQRALETLEPWAHLHVIIDKSRNLPTRQPFAQVFVNDEIRHSGAHKREAWTRETPYRAAVGIHSPLSIVRIMVMDEAAEHDIVGFVEFRVGDLTPNAREPDAGWFELRLPWRLLGTGRARLRKHSRVRDDHSASDESGEAGSATVLEAVHQKIRGSTWGSHRLNAGEIHMSLALSAASADPTDEWYAFCLPRPVFTIFHRYAEVDDKVNPLDVMDLWRDIAAVKRLVWDHCLRHAVSVTTYVTSWQCPPLTAASLLWWLVVCWAPRWFLPTLPLAVAFWLRLLRNPAWRKCLLAHQATAPLDEEGFAMVAALGDSRRMAFWVERVVRSYGGQVLSLKAMDRFASLIFRARKPVMSFAELLECLRTDASESFIKWPPVLAPLNAEGMALVLEQRSSSLAATWLAQLIEHRDGVVQDQVKLDRMASKVLFSSRPLGPAPFDDLLAALRKQPWIVWRDYGLGEETGGPNDAGWWAHIPSWMIPRPVERLAYRLANPIEDLRKNLAKLFRWASKAFDPEVVALAAVIYWRCVALSVVASLAACVLDLGKVLWTLLGLAVATHRLPGVRQALTARRANSDLAECIARRETGGCTAWAFFTRTGGCT